jgi:2-aminoadipate transaminase
MSSIATCSLSDRFARRTEIFGVSIWTDILQAKEKHADSVYFGDGAPARELLPLDRMREASDRVWADSAALMGYGDQQGYAPLREAIVNHLRKRGIETEAGNVLVTGGSTQALDFACRVFLQEGDAIIVENPTFLGALEIFGTYGVDVIGVDCDEHGLDVDQLQRALAANPHAKAVYTIPTFQNPSGSNLPLERRERLVELAREFNVAIFEDDPYGDLQYSGEVIPPIRALYDQVLYFGTFSKIIAPGIRVGYVIAPDEVMAKLLSTREVADISNDRIMMKTVALALEDNFMDAHLERCRDLYRIRRDAMLAAMEREMPQGVHWSKPDGGFFVWITLPDHIDSHHMFDIAAEHGVVPFPGEWFGPSKEMPHTIRLSFSTVPEDRIELGISRLGQAIRTLM